MTDDKEKITADVNPTHADLHPYIERLYDTLEDQISESPYVVQCDAIISDLKHTLDHLRHMKDRIRGVYTYTLPEFYEERMAIQKWISYIQNCRATAIGAITREFVHRTFDVRMDTDKRS